MDSGVNVYDETWLTLTVSNKTCKLCEKHFHKLLLKTLALTVLESAFFVVWYNILLSIWLNTQFVQFKIHTIKEEEFLAIILGIVMDLHYSKRTDKHFCR